MFSRIALLFAPSLLAASAAAQNAVGLWRSDDPDGQNLGIGQNIPDGTVGVRGWTVLPPDVTMYFKPQAQGAARELDFRGIEFRMFLNVMNSAGVQEVPKVEIRRAIQAAIPNQARYVPDYVTPPYAVFPAQAWVGTGNRVFRYVLPESVPVPSGSSAGTGLCAVFVDYCKFGASPVSSGEKALLMVTDNESGSGSNGFSGFTSATGNNTFVGSTNEFTVNFLFDQSMMQPAKNVTLVQPGADLLDDKGPYPPNVTALLMDDGRGALRMNASNVISFMVNSDKSLHGSSASTWIVPLIMLENDIAAAGTTNPTPENWVGNSNAPDLAYVHPMPMQKFLDDLATSAGSPPNSGVGAALNPRNTTLPIWLGVDLPSFQNLTILARSLTYADISSGVFVAGTEQTMFNSTFSPNAVMARNLGKTSGEIREMKHAFDPQTGWSPIAPGPTSVGLFTYPGGSTFLGKSFYIMCLIFDVASPTSPLGFEFVDVTPAVRIALLPV